MEVGTERKKRIIIATDGSEFSQRAIKEACNWIRPHNTEILCISTFEMPPPYMTDPAFSTGVYTQEAWDILKAGAEVCVKNAMAEISKHFSSNEVSITTETPEGPADKIIVEKAEKWHADLIVVGSHGRGFWGRLLGSVSNGIVHHAPYSVLVVK